METAFTLDRQPPRDINEIRQATNLRKGVNDYFLFGIFFMTAILFPIALSIPFVIKTAKGIPWFEYIFSLIFFEGIGLLMVSYSQRIYKRRLNALKNGRVIEGKVVEHQRKFNPFKSSRDYSAVIEYTMPDGTDKIITVVSSNNEIYDRLPIGLAIPGLFDEKTNSAFFPVEIDIVLHFR